MLLWAQPDLIRLWSSVSGALGSWMRRSDSGETQASSWLWFLLTPMAGRCNAQVHLYWNAVEFRSSV